MLAVLEVLTSPASHLLLLTFEDPRQLLLCILSSTARRDQWDRLPQASSFGGGTSGTYLMVSARHCSHVGPPTYMVPADPENRLAGRKIPLLYNKQCILASRSPQARSSVSLAAGCFGSYCVRALEMNQHGSRCFLGQREPQRVSTS